MTMLSIKNLKKNFGALKVTDELSLEVEEHEIHAIIGPNGAGKTTLIAQLSGQLQPDSGQVIFDGSEITHLNMAQRAQMGIARSFQITSILPQFSVLENVALGVQSISGSSFQFFKAVAREEALNTKAQEILSRFDLAHRADMIAGSLSHGEHRKLELAMALAIEPKILLLDEPLAGIGGQEAEAFINHLKTLKGRYTTLLIEHDMDAVFALADRISVLVYGKIIATGSPAEIRNNKEVRAAYLGEEEVTNA